MCRVQQDTVSLVGARGRKYLTREERERFLEAVRMHPRPEVQTVALTLVHTGCRISEAPAVRSRDVDGKDTRTSLPQAGWVPGPGRTDRRHRGVPVPTRCPCLRLGAEPPLAPRSVDPGPIVVLPSGAVLDP